VISRVRRLLAGGGPKLLTDLAVLVGGQFGAMLVATAAFAILARELDPQTYGAVEYVVGLTALFGIAVEGGLATVGVRRVAQSRDDLPALATLIPLARMLVALAAIPLLIVAVELLGPAQASRTLVLLFAASLLLWAWNQDWLLQSVELMGQVALARMLRMLVFLTAVILLVHGPEDVAAVGLAELAGLGAAFIYYVGIQHFKVAAVRIVVSIGEITTLIREGAAIALTTFAWSAAQYMPLFLVGSLVGGAGVGLYAASQRIVTALSILSFVYYFNLYPTLARSVTIDGEFARLLQVSFRVVAWGSIGLGLGLSLAASPLVSTIFGAQFADAAPALALLVWSIPATFLSGEARWALITLGEQRRVLYAQLAGLATIVAAGVPLILLFAEVGAAAAAVAGAIVVWIVAHAAARSVAAPLAPRTLVVKPVMVALACAAAVQLIDAGMLAKAVAAVALYAAAAPFADHSLLSDLSSLAHAKTGAEPVPGPVESPG
jgi:O-antigen/teichoic acid export membrane protein